MKRNNELALQRINAPWGRSPIGRGKALKPPPVRVRVPPPLRSAEPSSLFSSVVGWRKAHQVNG